SAVSCKPCYGPPGKQQAQLDGLRSCQLQDRACQITVGKSQMIQDREVVCIYDRNQATGEMSLSPVSMEIPTARDHRRQLTRAIADGQWLINARQAHWRKVSISTSVNLTLSLTWGESRSGASSNTPEIASPAATRG